VKPSIVLLTVALCLAGLAACGSSPTASPPATEMATSVPTPTLEQESGRYYEPAGGFSYIPPAGWELVEASGTTYKVALGPLQDDFTPNLVVVDEPFDGTLDEYVSASLANMSDFFEGFQLISQDAFAPLEGPAGVRLVVENAQGGRRLRHSFYCFDAGARKFVLTGTQLSGSGASLEPTFDAAARTFRFESE
jgi:hypothetical protein